MKFTGHIYRARGIEHLAMTGKINGKKSRGRQRTTYVDSLNTWENLEQHTRSQFMRVNINMKHTKDASSDFVGEENQLHQIPFVSEKLQPYLYLRVNLTIDKKNAGDLDGNQYKFLILQALKETLGQVGAAYPVDLLRLFGDGGSLIRIPRVGSEKIWAALTLYGTTTSGNQCAFRVQQASPFLMSLAFNSRDQWDTANL
ncbi:ribonuclease P protein subunit p14 [Elysia marginata]|uniref:Ribonuclease P protein subunit p14 n=1 Tax=Elysia marginata TaxID=1093978 RepID=A0AAV4J7E8_9GAST|nr:ribonuclease P protein subunit p14 [Elysia marginata]